jgi:hypothetical protein
MYLITRINGEVSSLNRQKLMVSEDLYAIIKVANKTVENETKDFYAKELIKNGVAVAPSVVSEDVEAEAAQRGPVPFGVPLPASSMGSGNGNGDVVMGEPMTLAQAGA